LRTCPQFFGSWFLDTHSAEAPQVLAYAGPLIVIAGLFQLVDGLQAIANGLLRGLKDARVPMIMALIAYWPIGFFLRLGFAFPLGLRRHRHLVRLPRRACGRRRLLCGGSACWCRRDEGPLSKGAVVGQAPDALW
jgi:hypothetical protein